MRGSLIRDEPQVARALTQALLDAAMFTAQNPDKAAKSFQPYAPKTATLADLEAMARYHTHHHHPVGDVLKRELKAYADDLKKGFGLQAQHRYGQIRGEDLCRRIRLSDGDRRRGARARRLARTDRATGSKSSGIGVAAAIAWVAFGLSSLWWPDHRRLVADLALGIAAFVVAAFALFGTLSADFLGVCGPALRRRAPWLVALGLFLTAVGSSRPPSLPGCRCHSSRRRNRSSRSTPTICQNCSTASLRR